MAIRHPSPPPSDIPFIFNLNTAVTKLRLKLVPEREYLFTHKRKRTFPAVFKKIVRAPSTDALDEFYYECEVDSALSGNPWNDSHQGSRATLLLRPSMVTLVQNLPPDFDQYRHRLPARPSGSLPVREEHWVKECLESLRSAFRGMRR
jgi:hypothetical protein